MIKIIKYFIIVVATCVSVNANAEELPEVRKFSFAWGAEIDGNIDLSAHNMSAIGLNAELGIRWHWIRFLGIGIEGDIMVSNSSYTYPLFLNFRTDFSNSRKLLFMDLRGGMAFNTLYGKSSNNPYGSAGVGITLAYGKTFTSHIILAYTYLGNDTCRMGTYLRNCPGISLATLRLGIAF